MKCRRLEKYYMPNRDRFAWLLLTATALAAMVVGHAMELWLENVHALGGRPAPYNHVAQSFVMEMAALAFVIAGVAIVSRLVALATRSIPRGDSLLPALHAIAQYGVGRVISRLVTVQLLALLLTEFCEQRLSGFQGNALLSIVGPGHATTLAVHTLLGSLAAFLLFRFARFASARTRSLVNAVVAFLGWVALQPKTGARLPQGAGSVPAFFARKLCLISLGLANRPPPLTSVHFA